MYNIKSITFEYDSIEDEKYINTILKNMITPYKIEKSNNKIKFIIRPEYYTKDRMTIDIGVGLHKEMHKHYDFEVYMLNNENEAKELVNKLGTHNSSFHTSHISFGDNITKEITKSYKFSFIKGYNIEIFYAKEGLESKLHSIR